MNNLKTLIIALFTMATLISNPVQAGNSHSHDGYKSKQGHNRHHQDNKRHKHNNRYHHDKHHHSQRRHKHRHHHWSGAPWCPTHFAYHFHHGGHHAGHIIGGLALGAIISSAIHNKHHRDDSYSENTVVQQSPPIIFRQTKDGKCFQVFYNEKGDEYLTPVAPANCGGN